MANDTYTANADGSCFVGRFNLPSWVRNQALNTWGVVPLAQTWNDVDPAQDPLVNPNFPGDATWRAIVGFPSRFTAWNGYTSYGGVIYDQLSGGHNDYAGNEGYKCDLNSENPSVIRLNNPSGAIGNEILLDDGVAGEATGLYLDGRPRSPHNYNSPVYFPPTNKTILAMHGTAIYRTATTGTKRPVISDPDTGEMVLYGADPGSGMGNGFSMCGTYDANRQEVWARGGGTSRFSSYNPITDSWTQRGALYAMSGDSTCCHIPEHDVIVLIAGTNFVVFDCVTYTYYPITLQGSLVGMTLSGNCQIHYVGNNTLATWNNDTDTTVINTFSFTGDPRSAQWQIGQLAVDATNAVTPTAKVPAGTFGKFQWHPTLKIFTLTNRVNEPMYFFKVA